MQYNNLKKTMQNHKNFINHHVQNYNAYEYNSKLFAFYNAIA